MPSLKIVVQSKKDWEERNPNGNAFSPEEYKNLEMIRDCSQNDLRVQILEGGTQSGATSISFFIQDAEKGYVMFQLTQNLLEGILAAVNGANQRFQDEKTKQN